MATVVAMFPGVKDAFARLSREDFGGTAIQSTTTIDAVKSAEQMKQQAAGGSSASSDEKSESALGRRRDRRLHAATPAAAGQEAAATPNANPARSTFMTINNDVLKITPNVTAAEVALPAGFKEN